MTKASAICTCATCGETWTATKICRNCTEADSWEEWAKRHFDECPDCRKARIQREREAENTAAAKAAEEAGLPELTGTEAQIKYAVFVRQKTLSKIRETVQPTEDFLEKFEKFLSWLCSVHTSAHWWLDHKDVSAWLETEIKAWQDLSEGETEAALRKAAEAEMVTVPENQSHSGVVEISVMEISVSARYLRDDDFREIVKGLGYRWNPDRRAWEKALSMVIGPAQERAAELGNHLLNAGFAVQIADPDTRQAAITGDYEPEHRRVIGLCENGKYEGWFCVCLPEHGDGMYEKARAIKGSRYCKPNVAVPVKQWREVLDFAEMNDYRISPAAQKIIDVQEAAIIVVTPAPVKEAVYQEHNPADILASGANVLDDLREED